MCVFLACVSRSLLEEGRAVCWGGRMGKHLEREPAGLGRERRLVREGNRNGAAPRALVCGCVMLCMSLCSQ